MAQLVWFKKDLRIYDNPALWHAMQQPGPTYAIFFICQQQWQKHGLAANQQSLILRQLDELALSLSSLGVELYVFNAKTFASIPQLLADVVKLNDIKSVYFNYEYELNERQCEHAVTETLSIANADCHAFHDQCFIAPGQVMTKTGDQYQVFTAFKKALVHQYANLIRTVYPAPEKQPIPNKLTIANELAHHRVVAPFAKLADTLNVQANIINLWPVGEEAAHNRLNQFLEADADSYDEYRDIPNLSATSGISTYLALGILSTSQCLRGVVSLNRGELQSSQAGYTTWINELIWREFYRHIISNQPELCRHKAYKTDTDRIQWNTDPELLKAWQQGRTGFPIVDAAMKQLLHTGWMHNRLRMITAMFLTKNLFIDWRLGEAYFMSQLVDGDFASNNGGWQWSASTGCDAAPYFRIFNPVRQSERFDPNGDFIRTYLPELSSLDNKSIHMPSSAQADHLGYPRAIVDLAESAAFAKAQFKALNDSKHQMPLI